MFSYLRQLVFTGELLRIYTGLEFPSLVVLRVPFLGEKYFLEQVKNS